MHYHYLVIQQWSLSKCCFPEHSWVWENTLFFPMKNHDDDSSFASSQKLVLFCGCCQKRVSLALEVLFSDFVMTLFIGGVLLLTVFTIHDLINQRGGLQKQIVFWLYSSNNMIVCNPTISQKICFSLRKHVKNHCQAVEDIRLLLWHFFLLL